MHVFRKIDSQCLGSLSQDFQLAVIIGKTKVLPHAPGQSRSEIRQTKLQRGEWQAAADEQAAAQAVERGKKVVERYGAGPLEKTWKGSLALEDLGGARRRYLLGFGVCRRRRVRV